MSCYFDPDFATIGMKGGSVVDQKKIGGLLRELRAEKRLTQERLAEILNVSGRTVSRWETGSNMPDISMLAVISEFYDISIPEIINGERKEKYMDEKERSVAEAMSDYAAAEKKLLLKRARIISVVGLVSLLLGLIMELGPAGWLKVPVYEYLGGCFFGLAVGALITMVLYTTGVLERIRESVGESGRRVLKMIAVVSFAIAGLVLAAAVIVSLS